MLDLGVEMRGGGLEEKRLREAERYYRRSEWEALVHTQNMWENNRERKQVE